MTFGELTANHLGWRITVHGGHTITLGRITHELYHGRAPGIRYWIYTSDRQCVLS